MQVKSFAEGILSTFIKLPFVLRSLFCLFLSGRLRQGFFCIALISHETLEIVFQQLEEVKRNYVCLFDDDGKSSEYKFCKQKIWINRQLNTLPFKLYNG